MRVLIRTEELNINHVPELNAGWNEISIFALSFDPMAELGTNDIYKVEFGKFNEESSLQELRTSLFLLQRAWNHRGHIDDAGLEELRKLLFLIRKKLIE
jgi:hypothetical protein